jgi:hypothetical protein
MVKITFNSFELYPQRHFVGDILPIEISLFQLSQMLKNPDNLLQSTQNRFF